MDASKGLTPICQLFDLLEARYALRVLWALRDGHPQTFRLLQDSVGGITPNTLNTRVKEMRQAGLINRAPGGYRITPLGKELVKKLGDLNAFAFRWVNAQTSQETDSAVESVQPILVVVPVADKPQAASPSLARQGFSKPES